jgi:hypothetical protein
MTMAKLVLFFLIITMIGCSNRQEVPLRSQQKAAPQIVIFGGNGESTDQAVVISGVKKQSEGIDAEYGYISTKYGMKNKDWHLNSQTIVQEQGKIFDLIEIELTASSEKKIYYFDVSDYSWKKK